MGQEAIWLIQLKLLEEDSLICTFDDRDFQMVSIVFWIGNDRTAFALKRQSERVRMAAMPLLTKG
jgi:hypothetical protein